MATPFGARLLTGDVMGTGLPANRPGLPVLNAWRELACAEPSLAGIAVRLHAMIACSDQPERFVTALLANFPVCDDPVLDQSGSGVTGGSWAGLVCCGHPPPPPLRGRPGSGGPGSGGPASGGPARRTPAGVAPGGP